MCYFNTGSDWEDPDDPMVIAETELNSAAITIEAAAKKLASLKPRMSKHHVSKILTYFCIILSFVCSFLLSLFRTCNQPRKFDQLCFMAMRYV